MSWRFTAARTYSTQLNQLKRGVHVVVGTPGRLMDHMRRKTVCLADLTGLVLDEADEMLQMGFIDDVEWILSQIPQPTQIALFSATMPAPIQKIAGKYLKNPEKIIIRHDTDVTSTIEQKYWLVKKSKKDRGRSSGYLMPPPMTASLSLPGPGTIP